MRTFVIGDIHGAYRALLQLIKRINPTEKDTLIFLGDYADGWSEVKETFDYLMELNQKYNCIFIRGNHDMKCYEWLKNKNIIGDWLIHGGKSTISSYENISEKELNIHLSFLEELNNYFIDDKNRLFIHAGFSSMKGVEKEEYSTNYYWDRTLWEMAYAMDKTLDKKANNYPKRLSLYSEIYIGHTSTTNYDEDKPIQATNLWNVDTGAAFTGKLTALNIDTKEFIQSDTVQHLYPNEKGRN